MKKFLYSLRADLVLSEPVIDHTFVLRAVPLSEPVQEPMRVSLISRPGCRLAESTDGLGNKVFLGNIEGKHSFFSFCSTGEVVVDASQVNNRGAAPYLRYPTPLTELSGSLGKYYLTNRIDASPLELTEYWMEKLSSDFRYLKGKTTTRTTAAEAWELGCGVCQDFAHVLLALLRGDGLICRYVAGLTVGEGESHAWVEVFDGKSWVAVDPTHADFCDDNYVKISQGPDFTYCALERGVFRGSAIQNMQAKCSLVPVE